METKRSSREVLLGFSKGKPVGVSLDAAKQELTVYDYEQHSSATAQVAAKQICVSGNRFLAQVGGHIVELEFVDSTRPTMSKVVGQCMENATKLFDGVAVQSMLGSTYCSVFPRSGGCAQYRTKELDSAKVIDARFDGKYLVCAIAKAGSYSVVAYAFTDANGGSIVETHMIANAQTSDLNVVALDNGMLAMIDDQERLVIFAGSFARTLAIDDAAISSEMRLCRAGGRLGFMRGGLICEMRKS